VLPIQEDETALVIFALWEHYLLSKDIEFIESITTENLTESPSIFSGLGNGDESYTYSGDTILVSTGDEMPVEEYKNLCNEFVVTHSHAKHSLYNDQPFMVGALARLYLHRDKLRGFAGQRMAKLEDSFDPGNILWNNLAQALEVVQSIERGIEIISELIDNGYNEDEEPATPGKVKGGAGTAATEAPRGTLYHSYTIDDKGIVTDADVITPTAINLENMEKDIRAAVELNPKDKEDDLKLKLEKVARAYDPCISCSVHLVDVSKEEKT